MAGGSRGSTTTVQQTDPWKVQQPFLADIFGEAQRLYDAPGPLYFPDPTVAPFAPETQAALRAQAARAMTGSPLNTAGQREVQRSLAGNYLGANPYLQNAVDIASQGLTRNYRTAVAPGIDSAFSLAGRYGSGAHEAAQSQAQQNLADQLGDVASGIAYRNYGDERTNMLQTLALAPQFAAQDYLDAERLASVGATREAQQQALINDQIARFNFAQQLPQNKLAQYLALIHGDYGGTTTTTQPYVRTSGSNFLTGAVTGAGLGGKLFPASSALGPWGPALGAGIGGLLSLF